MNDSHGHSGGDPRPARPTESHRSHHGRLVSAQADLDAAREIDLSVAGRSDMALTIERLRGALADMIRCEREHHS